MSNIFDGLNFMKPTYLVKTDKDVYHIQASTCSIDTDLKIICFYDKGSVQAMLYSYNNCINAYDWSTVKNADYGLWNAGYYAGDTIMGYNQNAPIKGGLGAWESCAMYQYTSHGRIAGWSGNLDLDVFYGNTNAWDKFAGGSAGAGTSIAKPAPAPIPAVNPTNQSMKNAQIHINNFTGAGIPEDGKNGPKTRKGLIMALQTACNMDYSSGLTVDGKIGEKTNDARGLHYVKRGEKQYLVTFVEIGLTALGYYSGAVEAPGIFGGGLEAAVDKFQNDTGLNNDKVAGRNVMDMILRKMGCI